MNKGDLLRCLGILTYVVLTIIDRFCFNIADYIYIQMLLFIYKENMIYTKNIVSRQSNLQ